MTSLRRLSRRLAVGLAALFAVALLGAGTAEAGTIYTTTTFTGTSTSLQIARQTAYSAIISYQQKYGNCYNLKYTEYKIATATGYAYKVVLTASCPAIA